MIKATGILVDARCQPNKVKGGGLGPAVDVLQLMLLLQLMMQHDDDDENTLL